MPQKSRLETGAMRWPQVGLRGGGGVDAVRGAEAVNTAVDLNKRPKGKDTKAKCCKLEE